MPLKITLDLTDVERAIQQVKALKDQLNNRKEPLERIKREQNRRWDANFTEQGRLYTPWAPLTAFSAWEKVNPIGRDKGFSFPGFPLMVRHGNLAQWVYTQNEKAKVGLKTLTWNFKSTGGHRDGSYAVFHSLGYYNTWAQASIAPRIIWDLDGRDETNAVDVLDEWIDHKLDEILN